MTVLAGFELRETRFYLALLIEPVAECSLKVHLYIGKSKAVHFFKERTLFLVLSRSNSRKSACHLISFDFV